MAKDSKDTKAKDIKKDDKKKNKKKRKGLITYAKEVFAELKKVTWPTKKEMVKYTAAVIMFVILFAAIVGGIDYLLAQGISLII